MNKSTKIILIGFLITCGLLLIAAIVYLSLLFKTMESLGPCGYNDGPYTAIHTERKPEIDYVESFDLSNNKKLLLYNENDTISPILILVDNNVPKWSLDIGIQKYESHPETRITKISEVSVVENTNTIDLKFLYHTVNGPAEGGTIIVNIDDGSNKICLSW